MDNKSRLQVRHYDGIFSTREKAYAYLRQIVDPSKEQRLDESLVGEPILVRYYDDENNVQAIISFGLSGETGDGVLMNYHIVDSAKLQEDINSLSGESSEILDVIEAEIERALDAEEALQNEIDATQEGAGLNADGTYTPDLASEYLKEATSLKNADEKLDII